MIYSVIDETFLMIIKRVNLTCTDSVYTITIGCTTHMQNFGFKFKFELCVMHLMVKMYTLSVYRRLILIERVIEMVTKSLNLTFSYVHIMPK